MLRELGPEFSILREIPLDDIERAAGPCIAEGIHRLREGKVEVSPGYDGEYGQVHILDPEEIERLSGQLYLFEGRTRSPEKAAKRQGRAKSAPSCSESAEPHDPVPHYGLNDEQWEAASSNERTVAVVAGPGTGKTRTLVYRIAYLVEQRGIDPSHITAVTFTNKAAREMKERLLAHFGDKKIVKAMTIGTFHAICLDRLSKRREGAALLDEAEAVAIAADILAEMDLKLSPKDALQAVSPPQKRLDRSRRRGKGRCCGRLFRAVCRPSAGTVGAGF